MPTLNELYDKRGEIITQAQKLSNESDFNSEKQSQFDKMMAEASDLKSQIDRIKQADELMASLSKAEPVAVGRDDIDPAKAKKNDEETQRRSAFRNYLRGGASILSADEARILASRPLGAHSTTVGSQGGFLVPQGFMDEFVRAEKQFNAIKRAGATVFETDTGNDLPWPTTNDTGNKGAIIGQNVVGSVGDMTFGSVTLKAYTYTSNIILVPNELLQDSAVDLNELIAILAAERIGRIQSEHFSKGAGTTEPRGAVTAATAVTAASATQLGFDDFVKIKYSVDEVYRHNANFMMHDDVIAHVVKIKDGENRPLFLPSARDGEFDTVLNRPVISNNDMANAVATTNKVVLFGDFSKYKVRQVRGAVLRRLEERYADANQTAFIMLMRADGNLVDGGGGAMKVLQMA